MNKYNCFTQSVKELENKSQIRHYTEVGLSDKSFPYIKVGDKECIIFSTCNYLGYADSPMLKEAAISGVEQYGVGTGGSRYIGGTSSKHHITENALASFHHKDKAVLYNNGYMANLGTIPCITQLGDVIFSDEKNHASIIDAIKLSKANKVIWRHNDVNDLESKLQSTPCSGKRIIVCETLYSMDGDFAPLKDIVALCEQYQCLLYVDEIHAIGVYGSNGSGYANQLGVEAGVDFLMGGTAKGLGSLGGYVCLPEAADDLVKSRSRSFIFTISLPVPILSAIDTAVAMCQEDHNARQRIHSNSDYLRYLLTYHGYNFLNSQSHLFPVMIGDSHEAKKATDLFIQHGIYVQGVQFPTVAEGQARLRVSVTAAHTKEHIDYFVSILNKLRDEGLVRFS